MGPSDLPPQHRMSMESTQLLARKAAEDSFYKELLSTNAPKTTNGMKDLKNIGQIAKMQIPQSWSEGEVESGKVGGSNYREFHVDGKDGNKFCFFYRGKRMSAPSAEAFHDVLAKPAHVLSSPELKSIAEVLDAKSDASVFNTLSARTESLNGKSVLIVEGRYKEKQVDTYALFLDSDGTGGAVQEVYYQAPKADFMSKLKAAKEALKTVEWK